MIQETQIGALYQSRGVGWGGRWVGGPKGLYVYLCLENPRDGGAWWAAVYGVTYSWTRLK